MNLNVPKYLDSKMIGMSDGIMRINEANTMTPRQNDLVVKNDHWTSFMYDLN